MNSTVQYLRSLPVIFVMGLIFWLSHQSGSSLQLPEIPFVDKLAHGLIYAVLAWSVIFAVPAGKMNKQSKSFGAVVIVFCLLYGLSDEFHQSFIPGRFPSLSDLAADVVGASMAVIAWYQIQAGRQQANRPASLQA